MPPTFEQGTPLIGRGNISVDQTDEQDDYAETFGGHMYLGHDETPGKHAEDCSRQFPFTETARRGENFLDVAGWKATDGPEPLSITGDYTQPGIDRAKGIGRPRLERTTSTSFSLRSSKVRRHRFMDLKGERLWPCRSGLAASLGLHRALLDIVRPR